MFRAKRTLVDDETQTGRTLIRDAEFLLRNGHVKRVDACVVHAALASGGK